VFFFFSKIFFISNINSILNNFGRCIVSRDFHFSDNSKTHHLNYLPILYFQHDQIYKNWQKVKRGKRQNILKAKHSSKFFYLPFHNLRHSRHALNILSPLLVHSLPFLFLGFLHGSRGWQRCQSPKQSKQ